MSKRALSGIMFFLLLTGMLTLAFNIQPVKAEPKTWYVDDSGGADFTKIQDAINAASAGDTIYVYNGTYYEHIYISKSLSLIGEDKYATIIDGSGYGSAVSTSHTQNVRLNEFAIRNAEIGVRLYYTSNSTISGNIITNSTWGGSNWGGGISLDSSYNNTVADNMISNTTEFGVWLNSYNNIVRNNTIVGTIPPEPSSSIGIYLQDTPHNTHDNTILGNIISEKKVGIYSGQQAYNNTIADNIIENLTSYECGINIWGPDNSISGNIITGMSYVGIQLNSVSSDGLYGSPNACANNIVTGNVISNCTFGINLILAAFSNTVSGNDISDNELSILISDSSDDNIIVNNLVCNGQYGILLFSSNNTKVYHNNFIDNAQQVLLSDSFNTTWDNGYPSGGNYWSNYAGIDIKSGPSQDLPGSDGIGDTSYDIDANNIDRYSLMAPFSRFDAGTWNGETYNVDVVSNSTISSFYFNPEEGAFLRFNVTGVSGTVGFCRVAIPKDLLWVENGWTILVDEEPVDYTIIPDENYTYLYFTYSHSTKTVTIQGTHVIAPPTYTLTITTTVGGTTDPPPGTYTYTANSTVQVTAIPEANYKFDYWLLDGVNVGSANPYMVLMDNNHTLKAVFSPIPPLSATITPLSASILVGQSVTFTSTVSGGYPPYSYQWYLNGAPVSGATANTWAFTPTTSGIYYVYLKVTDAKGNTAQSDTARISVAAVPVGGYSIPIQTPATAKPLTPYLILTAILTIAYTTIKRKTTKKTKKPS